ncbi:hypothetical protein BJI49_04300 [Acetobacter pasteurianus]|uniref:hypothetical protein n=1 Tax=Acetobacter pasteurianus TaxID=438 RepID=UPI0005546C2C|nr:hypothetical protein [Acetobacter pasteurianus]RCL08601.1 hypothetical protein BJI49_04300 [Acetobacter pasteurianus]GCD48613.1 hypothetical protein NBRC106471_0169 [Acetobacter pasteurianus subsp. pasteurianus LMG 1262 = NBRC 106471]
MQVTLTLNDLNALSDTARQEIQELLFPKGAGKPEGYESYDWDNVYDLTEHQIERLVAGLGESSRNGLKVIAHKGPAVDARELNGTGVSSYGSFQSGIHRRLRKITGDDDACLFTFDDWSEDEDGIGHFVVSLKTFESLKNYFKKQDS